jgi:hypothetical protein
VGGTWHDRRHSLQWGLRDHRTPSTDPPLHSLPRSMAQISSPAILFADHSVFKSSKAILGELHHIHSQLYSPALHIVP